MGGALLWSRPPLDRRAHRRVNAELRCFYPVSAQAPGRYVGLTENLSRTGLLIRWEREPATPELPRQGDRIAVELEWPLSRGPERRYLCCRGSVVWVRETPGTGPALVAVRVQRMAFRSRAAAPPERQIFTAAWRLKSAG